MFVYVVYRMAELCDRIAAVLDRVRSSWHDPMYMRSLCRVHLHEDVLLSLRR